MTTIHFVKRRGVKLKVILHWHVQGTLRTWNEHHPYGTGTAAEEISEAEVEAVELEREEWPHGFETEELTDSELKFAEKDALGKARENAMEYLELAV